MDFEKFLQQYSFSDGTANMPDEPKVEMTEQGIKVTGLPGETEEQLMARLLGKDDELAKKPASPKSSRSKKSSHVVSDPVSEVSPVDCGVFSAVHVYQRRDPVSGEQESDATTRTNAVQERRMFGPNVLVFQHLHCFGEACNEGCREKVHDPNKDAM